MTSACIFGCAGLTLSDAERDFFRDVAPWGFIVFKRNIDSPDQLRRLTDALRETVDRPDAQRAFAIQARNLAALARAGVTIALGTDGNTPWGPHLEMADMVAAGMTPAQVLVAATRNGAALLGLADAGTVEPGRNADFIVLDADPLADITNTRRIADVYLRGVRVAR